MGRKAYILVAMLLAFAFIEAQGQDLQSTKKLARPRHPRETLTNDNALQVQIEFLQFIIAGQNDVIHNLTTVVANQSRQTEELKAQNDHIKEQNKEILEAVLAIPIPTTSAPPPPRPRDCSVLRSLGYNDSAVYTIFPTGEGQEGVEAFCDMSTGGGGWTVFFSRQRQETPVDFAQTWRGYADGFGSAKGEYWLGNRHLHALTKDRPQVLRVDIEASNGAKRFGEWNSFAVGDENSKFVLRVEGFSSASTLGDQALNFHNGKKFSTMDQDNDERSGSCSSLCARGGWWYGKCYAINPTATLRTSSSGAAAVYTEANTRHWDGNSDRKYTAIGSIKMMIRSL